MLFAGVPLAGLWTIFVFVVAVAQLPPLLILGPLIAYVLGHAAMPTALQREGQHQDDRSHE